MENTTLLLVEQEAPSEPGAETPILFQGHQAQGSRADKISVPGPWGFQPGKKLCVFPQSKCCLAARKESGCSLFLSPAPQTTVLHPTALSDFLFQTPPLPVGRILRILRVPIGVIRNFCKATQQLPPSLMTHLLWEDTGANVQEGMENSRALFSWIVMMAY